ncbi:23S rRNA (adenine(2030)-N(6))-methyltransferase RlmJ [Idiomarina seosinensis]|uniref:Ribosomal RNA large subunit methyltransferase J n=1 Tax=Idiomarina seosinensis TaxID=281739 RepID=A0A432Z772_9GAMM|nr:23S rRNA (adenine(2030)-N(6))-methyltransferase RlmJ [Idiomarina seosinensis]RUO73737.1 23S rRNA (adenine(2030)-N(6))-methyltransferase RlmJ [Idiomarina seosinensis]
MNYRHIYHAGNFADVFKHLLLTRALNHFNKKNKPYMVLDTHGGIGKYDLDSELAGKTEEFTQGISRLVEQTNSPAFVQPYIESVKQLNDDNQLRFYPGSPWLIQALMRADDRLIVCELHQQDAVTLKQTLRPLSGSKKLEVLAPQDGYQAVSAKLPPAEKRGLVVIDPPFEQVDEFDRVIEALTQGLRRWQSGSYALWYPIKDPVKIANFHRDVTTIAGIPKTLVIELMIRSPDECAGLNGCGFVWVNPPFGLVNELDEILAYISPLLAQSEGAESHYRWLVEES